MVAVSSFSCFFFYLLTGVSRLLVSVSPLIGRYIHDCPVCRAAQVVILRALRRTEYKDSTCRYPLPEKGSVQIAEQKKLERGIVILIKVPDYPAKYLV